MDGSGWPDAAWDRLRRWHERAFDNAAVAAVDDAALEALSDIGVLRRRLDECELAAVRAARGRAKSWAELATRLGVTRQSAWERWRDLDDEAPHRPGVREPLRPRPSPRSTGGAVDEYTGEPVA